MGKQKEWVGNAKSILDNLSLFQGMHKNQRGFPVLIENPDPSTNGVAVLTGVLVREMTRAMI